MSSARQVPPSLYAIPGGLLSLSGPALEEFLRAVLELGASFRFRARGVSMYPFVKDGDVISVEPFGALVCDRGCEPHLGDVVAFCHPQTGRLVVHRAVAWQAGSVLVRGDNSPAPDGWVDVRSILGRVSRVDRGGRSVKCGLGPERILIAWLAGHGMLIPLVRLAHRAARPVASCLRARGERKPA